MHFIHKNTDGFGIRKLTDAVAEIKDMTAFSDRPVSVNNAAGFPADCLFTGKKHHRIHIALQSHLILHTAAGRREIDAPVHTHTVRTAGRKIFKPVAASLGENNDRHFLSLIFTLQRADHVGHVLQRKFLVNTVGQRAAPGIKNLNSLSARLDLRVKVCRH